MRKFIINIILFLAILVAFDICFGIVMDYFHSHSKGDIIQKRYYVAKEITEDIVMFGSSRMTHHYNPFIIEDSTGQTCYNAGEDGNGIIMMYGYFRMMIKRHIPKLVIYEMGGFDYDIDDNAKYLKALRPFCDDEDVMNVITTVDPNEKWKLYSNMYKYSSTCLKLTFCYFRSPVYEKGYIPLTGSMDYEKHIDVGKEPEANTLKLRFIEMLIKDCRDNNIQLVFSRSPSYRGDLSGQRYTKFIEICERYDIPFFDFIGDEDFCHDKTLFKDATHMNHDGADAFTRKFLQVLKREHLLDDIVVGDK